MVTNDSVGHLYLKNCVASFEYASNKKYCIVTCDLKEKKNTLPHQGGVYAAQMLCCINSISSYESFKNRQVITLAHVSVRRQALV